jgi:acetyltransferase-like isoleucine patch superfamily enzyme
MSNRGKESPVGNQETPSGNASPRKWREFSTFGVLLVAWDRCASKICRLVGTARTRAALRLLGCRCGPGLCVEGTVIVRAPRAGAIEIGECVLINSRIRANLVGLTQPAVLQCLRHGRIKLGDHSGLSSAVLSSRASITIGRYVMIGGNVRIFDHDWHSLDPVARRAPELDAADIKCAPIMIGDDVFIGANAIILKGVTIGARSIVAAGSVVTLKDIPEDSLVAGNPARIIKSLSYHRESSRF